MSGVAWEEQHLCTWCQWALSWNWDGGYTYVLSAPGHYVNHLVEVSKTSTVCRRVNLGRKAKYHPYQQQPAA